MQRDEIHIEELTIEATVGVPEAERKNPQRLVLSITLLPTNDFRDLSDDLNRTVDYAAVAEEVTEFVRGRATKLIETLANDVATHLLERFALREISVEVRKFIVPHTKHVSVRVRRTAEGSP